MQRWKEEFVVTERKKVYVHPNGDFEHGKVLYMDPDWDHLNFLHAASQRLDMVPHASRVFNSDGVEVDDCMMIEDDDMLFLSQGDSFLIPADLTLPEGTGGPNEILSPIPHIIGGYKVGELLGRGGFGEVRVGEHSLTFDKVALKFLRKADILSLGAAERTNTEIQCLTALKHAHIIRLQHHMETVNHVVLVFELMEGGDLMKFLLARKARSPTGRPMLNEDEARHVFYQVLSAISYAHNQHICHRDLKLENILLKDASPSTALSTVKIADFGLSDFYRPGALIKCSCGTLSFLAPEVFRGTANAGPPLDVWSLGVILFACVSGRLPFEGPDISSPKRPREGVIRSRILKNTYKLDESLGPEIKDLLRRLLTAEPADRVTVPEIFNHIWVRTPVNQAMLTVHAIIPPSVVIPTPPTSSSTTDGAYTFSHYSPNEDGTGTRSRPGSGRPRSATAAGASALSAGMVEKLFFPVDSSPSAASRRPASEKAHHSHFSRESSDEIPADTGSARSEVIKAPVIRLVPLRRSNSRELMKADSRRMSAQSTLSEEDSTSSSVVGPASISPIKANRRREVLNGHFEENHHSLTSSKNFTGNRKDIIRGPGDVLDTLLRDGGRRHTQVPGPGYMADKRDSPSVRPRANSATPAALVSPPSSTITSKPRFGV